MTNGKTAAVKKFGTFLGVYTPSILTILGLIMYLRFGWVLGNLGLGMTILVVLLASSITFVTGLSASAIATNIKVGVGGEYFLVSRSLGLEPGGAIGIPLYLCRTLSVTFYSFGLAESILSLWPVSWGAMPSYYIQLFAAGIIVLVTLLAGKSASLVLKSQLLIMVLVGASLIALIIGVFMSGMQAPELKPTYRTAPEGFWYVFAVFFPAVTGFTAGIGMSGDLKNPGKSIPRGTLGAVISGALIYLIIPVLLSVNGIYSAKQMADPDSGISTWTKVALLGSWVVYPAVWGAVLSSGFGSILGGPRVLQALAMDKLAPKFFAKLSKGGQPQVATWVSGAIALVAVSLGNLNTVAQFVSVLFLTLYVAINLSAAVESLVAEPSYRPRIRVPWFISLAGALGAIAVMFLINPIACIVAIILELVLFIFLKSRSFDQQWGDVAAGFWVRLARFSLLQLGKRKITTRNWRPLMLIFTSDISHNVKTVKLAGQLGQNNGIITLVKLLPGGSNSTMEALQEEEMAMREELKKYGLQAFCEVHGIEGEIRDGILSVSDNHGIGRLRSNTVVFGWSEQNSDQKKVEQLKLLRDLDQSGKNILVFALESVEPVHEVTGKFSKIDIWWQGKQNNGDLMLLCAYLLKLNPEWGKAEITVRSVVRDQAQKEQFETEISALLPAARIEAHLEILIKQEGEPFVSVLHERSRDADIVFMGLPIPEVGAEPALVQQINSFSSGLKNVIYVRNNSHSGAIPELLKLDIED